MAAHSRVKVGLDAVRDDLALEEVVNRKPDVIYTKGECATRQKANEKATTTMARTRTHQKA